MVSFIFNQFKANSTMNHQWSDRKRNFLVRATAESTLPTTQLSKAWTLKKFIRNWYLVSNNYVSTLLFLKRCVSCKFQNILSCHISKEEYNISSGWSYKIVEIGHLKGFSARRHDWTNLKAVSYEWWRVQGVFPALKDKELCLRP